MLELDDTLIHPRDPAVSRQFRLDVAPEDG